VLGFLQEWPVVQTAFFLAELLVLEMKMHSYIMTNRDFDKEYSGKIPSPKSGIQKKGFFFLIKNR
jgi:hypothetical protein